MYILAIVSSYRAKGNTSGVVKLIEGEMRLLASREGAPLRFETVYLGEYDLQMCRGCRVCFDIGEYKCPLRDDLLTIKSKMKAADGLIFASPVYVGDVNAPMKNLIDRLAHVCHRPEYPGKCVYFLATTGGSSTSHAIRTMGATISWGWHMVGSSGFKTGARMPHDEIAARYQKEIQKVARKLFTAVQERRYARPSFLSLMTFKIQQWSYSRADQQTLDYQYWAQQNWTNPKQQFFIQHNAHPMVVTMARLVGGMLGRLWA
jgi:multimeric flavodoxin WrbA